MPYPSRERETERERKTENGRERARQRERDSLLPVGAIHKAHFWGFQIFYWSSHGASLLLLLPLDLHGLITFTAFTIIAMHAQTREGERERERDRDSGNDRETERERERRETHFCQYEQSIKLTLGGLRFFTGALMARLFFFSLISTVLSTSLLSLS